MHWARATLFVLLLFIGLQLAFELLARLGFAGDLVLRSLVELLLLGGCTLALLQAYAHDLPAGAALGLRSTHPGLFLIGLLWGVALKLPAQSLREQVERIVPAHPELAARQAELLGYDSWPRLVGLIVAIGLVGPTIEEVLFRGALYRALFRRYGVLLTVIASSLYFVVVHADWRAWPAMVVPAGALGVLRGASGSLLPPIALHVTFNTANLLGYVDALGESGVASNPIEPMSFALLMSWLVSFGLLWLMIGWSRSEAARTARWEDGQ